MTKDMLKCSKCGETKPCSEFSVRKSRPRGYNSHCKSCVNEKNKLYYSDNAEANRAYAAEYRKKNPNREYQAAYREANRAKLREYFRDYAKANPDKKSAIRMGRRARKAVPAWADKTEIAFIYELAVKMEKWLGRKFHVDHIVPLVNANVCGLHCEANLQIVYAEENLRKGNRYWPDMP